MIDQNSRNQLAQRQNSSQMNDHISRLTEALANHPVINPKPQTPAEGLAQELRALQKVIGGGNLTATIEGLTKALDNFEVNDQSVTTIKQMTAELNQKLRILADVSAKIPTNIQMNFPKVFPVSGKVDVGEVSKLPDVRVSNLSEVSARLGELINSFQAATVKAIAAAKPEIPDSVSIKDDVTISHFQDLLDGIEELKNGFNLLINREEKSGGVFNSNGVQQIEMINYRQMIPQPVTNININPLRGLVATTAITVGTTPTRLPGTSQTNRRALVAYNNSASTTIYVGGSDVTSVNGMVVPAGTASPSFDIGPNVLVYAVCATGSADVRVMEVSSAGEGGSN